MHNVAEECDVYFFYFGGGEARGNIPKGEQSWATAGYFEYGCTRPGPGPNKIMLGIPRGKEYIIFHMSDEESRIEVFYLLLPGGEGRTAS
jgi:hypothetical protein